MRLSKIERLLFANQYKLLAAVDSEEKETYQTWIKALEHGFESAYSQMFDQIYDGLTEEECDWVVNVLCVYDALQRSFSSLNGASGIEAREVVFPGFDGNDETLEMIYARYVRSDEGRFDYLDVANKDLNSHFPTREVYSRMIEAWRNANEKYDLSPSEMRAIIDARIHPSRR